MARCPNCGSTSTAYNDARGETVCTECGTVIKAGAMVDSVSFAGGGKMCGQFVDAQTGNVRGFVAMYGQRESRELALAKGFDNLQRVAFRLQMSTPLVEASKRLYNLALQRNFTLGRNNYYVVAACLYAICRREQHSLMLIDFSDAIMTPVRVLAQVFMKLVRCLSLAIRAVDPSIFMERFASEMNLGRAVNDVASTGVRLVQALQRDWIVTGRRPLGLCAAALLIASRYHRKRLNSEDIASIFRLSKSTIDKRVNEFKSTAVAKLKVKDFDQIDLATVEQQALPPCVLESQRKYKLEDQEPAHKKMLLSEQEVEEVLAIEDKGATQLLGSVQLCDSDRALLCSPNMTDKQVSHLATNITLAVCDTASNLEKPASEAASTSLQHVMQGISDNAQEIVDSIQEFASSEEVTNLLLTGELWNPHTHQSGAIVPVPEAGAIVPAPEAGAIVPAPEVVTAVSTVASSTNLMESSLALCNSDSSPCDGVEEDFNPCSEIVVEDVDVGHFLLTEEEVRSKTLLFDEVTKDIMPLVYQRQRARKRRAALNGGSTRKRCAKHLPEMSSAAESVKAALVGKSSMRASRVNDDAVSQLFT